MHVPLLQELVILLAVSVIIVFISQKAKIPPVIGFLLTGVLIGPGGLSLVKDTATVDALAEIGVVMLLFTIGLEFEPARLKRIQRNFWAGGGLQVLLTTAACTGILTAFSGLGLREALFYGFLVSLSSTAVVLKILADRGETDSPQGRISLGVLIFQDIAIVPMLALVPVLADTGGVSAGAIALRFGLSAARDRRGVLSGPPDHAPGPSPCRQDPNPRGLPDRHTIHLPGHGPADVLSRACLWHWAHSWPAS